MYGTVPPVAVTVAVPSAQEGHEALVAVVARVMHGCAIRMWFNREKNGH